MRFEVDLTVPEGTDPEAVAEWLLDLLCGDPDAVLSLLGDDEACPYESCDAVDPVPS